MRTVTHSRLACGCHVVYYGRGYHPCDERSRRVLYASGMAAVSGRGGAPARRAEG